MASYGLVWPCMALFDLVGSFLSIFTVMAMYSHIRYTCVKYFGLVWSLWPFYGLMWHFMVLYGRISYFLAVIDPKSFGLVFQMTTFTFESPKQWENAGWPNLSPKWGSTVFSIKLVNSTIWSATGAFEDNCMIDQNRKYVQQKANLSIQVPWRRVQKTF